MRLTHSRAVFLIGAISLHLTACSPSKQPEPANAEASHGLEQLAAESGVISQDEAQNPAGSYGRSYEGGEDRLCVVPIGKDEHSYAAGVEIHIGEEEYCRGNGTARRVGEGLVFRLGKGCTIVAHYDGDQIVMPGAVDQACASLCSTRGSLAGVTFPRMAYGGSAALAATGQDGQPLCQGD